MTNIKGPIPSKSFLAKFRKAIICNKETGVQKFDIFVIFLAKKPLILQIFLRKKRTFHPGLKTEIYFLTTPILIANLSKIQKIVKPV